MLVLIYTKYAYLSGCLPIGMLSYRDAYLSGCLSMGNGNMLSSELCNPLTLAHTFWSPHFSCKHPYHAFGVRASELMNVSDVWTPSHNPVIALKHPSHSRGAESVIGSVLLAPREYKGCSIVIMEKGGRTQKRDTFINCTSQRPKV